MHVDWIREFVQPSADEHQSASSYALIVSYAVNAVRILSSPIGLGMKFHFCCCTVTCFLIRLHGLDQSNIKGLEVLLSPLDLLRVSLM